MPNYIQLYITFGIIQAKFQIMKMKIMFLIQMKRKKLVPTIRSMKRHQFKNMLKKKIDGLAFKYSKEERV